MPVFLRCEYRQKIRYSRQPCFAASVASLVLRRRVGMARSARLFVFFAILWVCRLMIGQTGTASISGMIVDSTGSAIANATVSARNTETGVVRKVQANSTGEF